MFWTSFGFSQTNSTSRILEDNQVDSIFTKVIKTQLNINYPIFRVYQYNDASGNHFFVLTENKAEDNKNTDTIQGFNILETNGKLKIEWHLTDFILKNGNENSEEFSIWFWTKYISFTDINNDGLIDPIIVYGTTGINGTDDGRVKILTYYKGEKRAIRHQNGVLDFERHTQVDSLFYELPDIINEYVKSLMKKMTENNHTIFPHGWETAMKNKELKFDEK